MVTQSFNLASIEYYLLIMARLASFFVVAPFYGMNSVPNRVKAGLASIVALLVMFALEPSELTYTSETGYAIWVLKEVVTGLIIGFSANVCSAIVLFAGNLIDMDIGLSMASQFDPSMHAQVTVTGNLYNYFFMMLFVASNMHLYVYKAIVDSFTLIPLGGAKFDFDSLTSVFTMYFVDLFILGFRIMMPIFSVILILNCILGVMAKVAPQMNMFSVGMQIKVLTGIIVLFIMVFLFPQVCELVFKEVVKMLRAVVRAMT